MPNGVIYARYSCDRQTENSILGQVRECRQYAERQGINIINIYKDEAISGRTATKRPAFMKMIHDSYGHLFDCVIVWKGDRFARNRADASKYKNELKKNNVRVLSATEANPEGAQAILMDGVNEAFAEYYSVELAEKVVRGMTENAIQGKYNGNGNAHHLLKLLEQVDPCVQVTCAVVAVNHGNGAAIGSGHYINDIMRLLEVLLENYH